MEADLIAIRNSRIRAGAAVIALVPVLLHVVPILADETWQPRPNPEKEPCVDYGLPDDCGAINVVRDCGAKGDGRADDTAAFLKAFEQSKPWDTIYVPDGIYLVRDTIYWRQFRTLQGQSRQKTIIRLPDCCEGYGGPAKPKPVIRCYRNCNMSIANWIENLTVDVGCGNPGAIGIRYSGHNQGAVRNVLIRSGDGQGSIGLDLTEDEVGPHLVRDLTVVGFDYGIKIPSKVSSVVLEHITVRNQNEAGIENGMVAAIRGLTSINSVPAVRNVKSQMGPMVLIDAHLSGGSPEEAAIENAAPSLYLRNVRSEGYRCTLLDERKPHPDRYIDELVKGLTETIGNSPYGHLKLAIKDPPPVFVEPTSQWVAVDGSGKDDTRAIQDAIDSGAKTIYFPTGRKYEVSRPIHVRGEVRRIVGLCSVVHAEFTDCPKIIFDGDGKRSVTVDKLRVSSWPRRDAPGYRIDTSQTVNLISSQPWGGWIGNGPNATGDLFIEDFVGHLRLHHPQRVWVRQCNPEEAPRKGVKPQHAAPRPEGTVSIAGAQVWLFGLKTEWNTCTVHARNGARVEILGGFFRDHAGTPSKEEALPYLWCEDAHVSASYFVFDWKGKGRSHALQARVTFSGKTRELWNESGNYGMACFRSYDITDIVAGL